MELPLDNLTNFIYSFFGIFIFSLSILKIILLCIDLLKDEL